jgi:hypothetical protein
MEKPCLQTVILEESLACGRAGFFQSSTVLDNKKDAYSMTWMVVHRQLRDYEKFENSLAFNRNILIYERQT